MLEEVNDEDSDDDKIMDKSPGPIHQKSIVSERIENLTADNEDENSDSD